jgi:hypothetical protein
MKISLPETGAVRQIADLPLRAARWSMEAVEAVEATKFCGGTNRTLLGPSSWPRLVFVMTCSGQVKLLKSLDVFAQHSFADLSPALTGSNRLSAFTEGLQNSNTSDRHTPPSNSFTYPIPHSITLCAINLHLSIFLHLSASTIVPSSHHHPVTRFPGPSQTYRRARSVLIPHVIATHPFKPHCQHLGSLYLLRRKFLVVIVAETTAVAWGSLWWGSKTGQTILLTFEGNG